MPRSASNPCLSYQGPLEDVAGPTPPPKPQTLTSRRKSLPSRTSFLNDSNPPPLPPKSEWKKPLPPLPPSLSTMYEDDSMKPEVASASRREILQNGLLTPPRSRKRHTGLFYLPSDTTVAEDDDLSGSGRSDTSDTPDLQRLNSDPRFAPKYHAFSELLETEWNYLQDLNVLVEVYLRQLSSLKSRPGTLASFGSSSGLTSTFTRSMSNASMKHPTRSSSKLAPEAPLSRSPSSASVSPTKTSSNRSPSGNIFTDEEIELLARNIVDIRDFHEWFVSELQVTLADCEFVAPNFGLQALSGSNRKLSSQTLTSAIEAVCKKFTREATSFGIYKEFCSGHPTAFDVLRRVQLEHATEWDAWEQRCASLVVTMRKASQIRFDYTTSPMSDSRGDLSTNVPSNPPANRRHSTLPGSLNFKDARPSRSSTDVHQLPPDLHSSGPRLMFMDYLIKPVQRICKYPLLFESLVKKLGPATQSPDVDTKTIKSEVHAQRACTAMRKVAGSIDEARRLRDLTVKSSLIVSRIVQPTNPSSSRSGHALTLAFLFSLGLCRLAGCLDVMSYRPPTKGSGVVKTRYFGAFLYDGGYLVLVKVSKGKVYEPRHWLSLTRVVVEDVADDESYMCSSFRVSYRGHRLDLAASCQREKEVWMSAITGALGVPYSTVGEPLSSLDLEVSQRPHSSHADADEANDQILATPPPPPPKIPTEPETPTSASTPTTPTKKSRFSLPDKIIIPRSRRSSLISLRAANVSSITLAPEPEATVLIRRAAPAARLLVERGLLDVMSDKCLSARFHASAHGTPLWQAPAEPPSPNFKVTFGVAAKNRLTRRESILVRAKSHRSIADTASCISAGDIPRSSTGTEAFEALYGSTSPPASYISPGDQPPRHPIRSASETVLPAHLRQSAHLPSPPVMRQTTSAPGTSRRSTLPNRKSLRSLLGIKPPAPKVIDFSYDYYIPPATTRDNVFKRWTGSLGIRRPSFNARMGDGRPSR